MAQFTLLWDNSAVAASANSTGQRVSYRQKSVGGAFITAGFTPANDLSVAVTTADSPSGLLNNAVYEFKVECLCTSGGPTLVDNGIREAIVFSCITPTTTQADTTANISINVAGLDITKARFFLKKSSDNSTVYDSGQVVKSGSTISGNASGLTAGTNYYWQIEMFSTVNTVEVSSAGTDYLGSLCSPYAITTSAPPVCNPITSMTVASIEVL